MSCAKVECMILLSSLYSSSCRAHYVVAELLVPAILTYFITACSYNVLYLQLMLEQPMQFPVCSLFCCLVCSQGNHFQTWMFPVATTNYGPQATKSGQMMMALSFHNYSTLTRTPWLSRTLQKHAFHLLFLQHQYHKWVMFWHTELFFMTFFFPSCGLLDIILLA